MKLNIVEKRADIEDDNINIIIESKNTNQETQKIIDYIKQYNNKRANKVLVIDGNIVKEIDCSSIILFYSEEKNNYCRTKEKKYKIKSKLYEIENVNNDFIRISKNCVVNINHVRSFDMGKKSGIIVKLDDETEEKVSRRRIKSLMQFLEERRI